MTFNQDPRLHEIPLLRERPRTLRPHGKGDQDAIQAEMDTATHLTNLELDMANEQTKLTSAKRKAT